MLLPRATAAPTSIKCQRRKAKHSRVECVGKLSGWFGKLRDGAIILSYLSYSRQPRCAHPRSRPLPTRAIRKGEKVHIHCILHHPYLAHTGMRPDAAAVCTSPPRQSDKLILMSTTIRMNLCMNHLPDWLAVGLPCPAPRAQGGKTTAAGSRQVVAVVQTVNSKPRHGTLCCVSPLSWAVILPQMTRFHSAVCLTLEMPLGSVLGKGVSQERNGYETEHIEHRGRSSPRACTHPALEGASDMGRPIYTPHYQLSPSACCFECCTLNIRDPLGSQSHWLLPSSSSSRS